MNPLTKYACIALAVIFSPVIAAAALATLLVASGVWVFVLIADALGAFEDEKLD